MASQQNNKPVTINDIASEAGTSIATVNRALRNHGRISLDTKQRILSIAERLGYRPSLVAQSLAGGKSNMIGVVVPMIGNSACSQMVRVIENSARTRGYSIILCDTDNNPELEREYVSMLYRRRVDGIAIIPAFQPKSNRRDYLVDLDNNGIPVVAMGYNTDNRLDQITFDSFGDSQRMVGHLFDIGHRCIGFVHDGLDGSSGECYRGYIRALAEYEISDPESYTISAQDSGGRSGAFLKDVREFLHTNPSLTAICCTSDMLASKVISIIRSLGISVPDDIAVVGCDDVPMAECINPPLTTIRQPAAKIGVRAIEVLSQRIENPQCVHVNECIAGEVVVRRSCGYACAPQLVVLKS